MPIRKPSKKRFEASQPGLLSGRTALLACMVAEEEFEELFRRQNENSVAESLCQHLSRLYKAMRDGWAPICKCWPGVMEVDRSPNWRAVLGPMDMPTRVAAWEWMGAKAGFWGNVFLSGHTVSAMEAWSDWAETYIPDPADASINLQDLIPKIRKIKQAIGVARPPRWNDRKTFVERSIEAATEQSSSAKKIRGPALPQPEIPLPDSQIELTRLLRRVERYVDRRTAFLSQWQVEYFAGLSEKGEPAAIVAHSRLESLISEIIPYLDPIDSKLRLAGLHLAKKHFRALSQETDTQKNAGDESTTGRVERARTELAEAYRLQLEPIRILRTKILAKLAEAEGAVPRGEDPNDTWVTATEAVEIAKRFGVKLRLPDITKLSRQEIPPFQSRPQKERKNRREVHLPSFMAYVLDRNRSKPDIEAEFDAIELRKVQARQEKSEQPGLWD